MTAPGSTTEQTRVWFNEHGWTLEPGELRAALSERGADTETIVELLDEGADRRRAQPPTVNGNGAHRVVRSSDTSPETGPHNVPPQNLEAEESVLGAMMMSPGAIVAVSEILHPSGSDFYRETHAKIYRAALNLYGKGEPVDAITLTDQLEEEGHLAGVGGRVRLHELAALVPASGNAGHYARIVQETGLLRGLIRAGGEITRLGYERPGEAADLVDQAQEIAYDLGTSSERSATEQATGPLIAVYQRMAELAEAGVEIIGTPTGYRDLDRVTSGLEPGNLAILAARPGMGKSALAHGIAAHIGIRLERPVAIFSLEMSKAELSQRFLAREAHVDLKKIRTPGRSMGQEEWSRCARAADVISKAPIYMNDRGGLTLLELRSELRRLKTRMPALALAVVDYLQLMQASAENRTQEITKISQGLKVIARDLDVPILALSQLNRAVEQRVDKRPQLSDLRESGSIEQDADLVMFLYRDGYYNEDAPEPNVCDLILAKHRNGPVGLSKLSWVPTEATFTDLHRHGIVG